MTRTATVRTIDPSLGPIYEEIDLDLQDELHRLRDRAATREHYTELLELTRLARCDLAAYRTEFCGGAWGGCYRESRDLDDLDARLTELQTRLALLYIRPNAA